MRGDNREMCDICRRFICPPACPSYAGISAEYGKRRARCTECGRWLYDEDDYIIDYGYPYCLRCAKLYGEDEEDEGGDE